MSMVDFVHLLAYQLAVGDIAASWCRSMVAVRVCMCNCVWDNTINSS